METKKEEFKPKQIGEENTWLVTQAIKDYSSLIERLTALKKELSNCLETDFDIDNFIDFLKHDPEKWVYKKFISINDVNFPGLSTEKIIELKMLDVKGVPALLAKYNDFKNVLDKVIESGFFYPLSKLYSEETKEFNLPVEFHADCDAYFSKFTQTPEQNEILEKFERLCEVLNELDELNIIRSKNGPDEIKMLTDFIDISKNRVDAPFVVTADLFRQHRTKTYLLKWKPESKKNIADFFE